jgi:acyl-CoA dehydrogenase
MLAQATEYAGQRRQFGRTIGSNQALRHILADMYVRESAAWSSILYSAAALDDDAAEARRSASITKAFATRATREVAHGAMQVFGGIAFTEEHDAHRFLRRINLRGSQFGDAEHHERLLGRGLAAGAKPKLAAA